MEIQTMKMTARLRIASVLVFIGLLIEGFTLMWNNPIAFLVFLGIGGLLMFIGIVFYLLSLVSPPATQ
ncbi:MAG: hypothetical protein DMG64_04265 [Acidobacteria bacterium]|nr:MAG: hypothetical protein DMG63_02610 [Acidobacteriota bacterium]PYY04763.1 MAG: hypothetical protein DMG64_04265 [Acidobacteriota bacterium]PYY24909.1 MAG: hypothetical protein DMG62_00815 [Acidobacteriota bacterium]